jgi:capsular polysaccharide transport system ATP-binding protein
MIELKNVTKFFRTKHSRKYILQDVTMTIPSGKNIGILGRNGAGKSTIMRMLGQIEFPNKGTISSPNTFSWPLGLSGGFVGNMTGVANVKFVCKLYGKDKHETKEIIKFVREFSELGDYFDMPIKTYSSGMKSRLSFGLSLAFDFDYMIIDETLSVGDARFKKKSKEALLKKIESCNVLLVSHDMGTLREICDAGIVVNNGQIEYLDSIEDAISQYENINKKAG